MGHLRTIGCLGASEIVSVKTPFSNFKFIEDKFGDNVPLRRILSQKRAENYSTIVVEDIESVGLSLEDDQDLLEAGVTLTSNKLKRLSFFRNSFRTPSSIHKQKDKDYLGYAILKEIVHAKAGRWIVFESVTTPTRHDNNFYHAEKEYIINCGGKEFKLRGNLYCQQNAITNVCAHVGLRTSISMTDSYDDFSYREMNKILKDKADPFVPNPPKGVLTSGQIIKILDHLGIKYDIQFYDDKNKPPIPYQRYIYGSIESGFPALLGFFFGGTSGHIIPILGHTFNEDTWTPRAQTMYKIGPKTRYVPSEAWVSTYICHDDNAGSHFCIPRQYIDENKGLFVIALRPKETEYSAPKAEAIAADYLYSFAQILNNATLGDWNERLKKAINTDSGWVVLRPIYVTGEQYVQHLKGMIGWESEKIRTTITDTLDGKLNSHYWMVEVSLPELFPANKRKLGEILLDAAKPLSSQLDLSTFVLARFPEHLYMLIKDPNQNIILKQYDTDIKTHTKIYGVVDEPIKILNIFDFCLSSLKEVAAKIKSGR